MLITLNYTTKLYTEYHYNTAKCAGYFFNVAPVHFSGNAASINQL